MAEWYEQQRLRRHEQPRYVPPPQIPPKTILVYTDTPSEVITKCVETPTSKTDYIYIKPIVQRRVQAREECCIM